MSPSKPHRLRESFAYRLQRDKEGYRLDFSILLPPPKKENGGMRIVMCDRDIILTKSETYFHGYRAHPKLSLRLVAEVSPPLQDAVKRRIALERVRQRSPILV